MDGDTNFSQREGEAPALVSLSHAGVNYVLFLGTLNLKLRNFLNLILMVVARSPERVLFYVLIF